MEMYYKPGARGGSRVCIPDGSAPEVVAAQREIAAAQGLLPVRAAGERPAGGRFGIYNERFAPVTDESGTTVAYAQRWEFHAFPVRLSQEKLLAHPAIAPRLAELAPSVAGDAELAAWWSGNLTYVRGSAMALKAMAVLGISQDELERVVLECRA